jgi:ribosomal protein S18 acetylase RimI-like enzyme
VSIEIRILAPGDEAVLANVAAEVFDRAIDPPATKAFLADPRHHLAVALDGATVVGFVSSVHYLHPDKPRPELWINEVSVVPTHRGRGLATAILRAVLQLGRELGCSEAWVLTDRSNPIAMRLYSSSGGTGEDSDHVMFTFCLNEADPNPPSGSP